MKVVLSPHDDDHALFTAYTCLREKPTIVVVLDSFIQPGRGEIGCDSASRARETNESCKVLGVSVYRCGFHDDKATYFDILEEFKRLDATMKIDKIYSPMVQKGNPHHDMVATAAAVVFGDRVVYYPTYTKTQLYTTGTLEIVPTEEEVKLKNESLDCYVSQIRINRPHFDAVRGKSEWLSETIS